MSNLRRWTAVGVGAAAGLVLAVGSVAWACIAGPTLNITPSQAKPGQEVTLSGFSYSGERPIVVRFNAIDGPVLGSFDAAPGRFGDPETLAGKVTIPADTKPGNYVLVAVQYAPDGSLAQVPVRALLTVTSVGGSPLVGAPAAPVEQGRSVGLVRSEASASIAALVFVGAGAAAVAGFVAWFLAVGPPRRQGAPQAVRVRQ